MLIKQRKQSWKIEISHLHAVLLHPIFPCSNTAVWRIWRYIPCLEFPLIHGKRPQARWTGKICRIFYDRQMQIPRKVWGVVKESEQNKISLRQSNQTLWLGRGSRRRGSACACVATLVRSSRMMERILWVPVKKQVEMWK